MSTLYRAALKVVLVGGVFSHSPFILAQAQVVDISAQPAVAPVVSMAASSAGEMTYQLQQLQQEVMELRGALEEQQHAIRRLQQSRLDDYSNIDKRIYELQQSVSAPVVETVDPTVTATEVVEVIVDAKQAYDTAYGYIKQQDFPQAIIAFESFLPQYPESTYAGNASYWLGELYVLRGDLDLAKASYSGLLATFPQHRKVPDASYKLARVHHEQGNGAEAKALLEKVVSDYAGKADSTVRLAQDFLRKNYP